ncbi:hypothetical protein IHE45_04G157700 [Dioscorea alata]|uniref:Uncharacterized protein n=1 Tax=Dioscorea alata TaxID=55571 RepID=A0ACB7WGQ8_DIOAL|nr:hypothetical protein IHE45_04G157700 [Dioscorea alata]
METPSSMRRVTRSQASSLPSHKKQGDAAASRSRTGTKAERSVLSDITNDSPIVGLAVEKTPSSALVKSRVQSKRTPGSGEALLRWQVKNLLEKVEEEGAGLAKKTSSGDRPLFLRASVGFPVSPAQLLAPTPANTPQIPSLSDIKEGKGSTTTTILTDSHEEVVEIIRMEEGEGEVEEEVIKRTLLFDSPRKSEVSDDVSSTVTYQESLEKSSLSLSSSSSSPEEDDNSSVWSLQVNVSGSIEEDEDDDEDGEVDDEPLQELCQELMKMTVSEEENNRMPEFAGKHTRFVYSSDGEIEGEELVVAEKKFVSPNVVVLKGLPVPQGKHLRFQEEEN